METWRPLMQCGRTNQEDREGSQRGQLDQSGWNRFIKWPGWLAVWDRRWWSIWQTVIYPACPAGVDTSTATAAPLPNEQDQTAVLLRSSGLFCDVEHKVENFKKQEAKMAWHSKNKEGQLVYTIIMLKQTVEMHQKHNASHTAAMFSYQ